MELAIYWNSCSYLVEWLSMFTGVVFTGASGWTYPFTVVVG